MLGDPKKIGRSLPPVRGSLRMTVKVAPLEAFFTART